jgi:hypothetical protein
LFEVKLSTAIYLIVGPGLDFFLIRGSFRHRFG